METIKNSENNKENGISTNEELTKWMESMLQSNSCLEQFKGFFEEEVASTAQGRNGSENGTLKNAARNEDKEIKRRRINEPTDGDNHEDMMAVTKSKLQNEAEKMCKESYNLRRYALLNNTLNKYSSRI